MLWQKKAAVRREIKVFHRLKLYFEAMIKQPSASVKMFSKDLITLTLRSEAARFI